MTKLLLRPAAAADVEEAYRWCERQRVGARRGVSRDRRRGIERHRRQSRRLCRDSSGHGDCRLRTQRGAGRYEFKASPARREKSARRETTDGASLSVAISDSLLSVHGNCSETKPGGVFIKPNVCSAAIAFRTTLGYCSAMVDLKLEVPVTEEVEVDAKTLAAIDRGAADADEGRFVSLEEVRKLVRIPKFESQKPR